MERFSVRRGAASVPVDFTVRVVSAYVSNNAVPLSDVGHLAGIVHKSFVDAKLLSTPSARSVRPAVPVKDSVTGEYIICLEDGRKIRSIKNHIETVYNLNPDQYRAKWNLPSDYPMVAPNYSALRSQMAKRLGLGRKPKTALGR
ncbi:MucR family transcriptional regulator [Aminobacter anthyllidis]|uniref:MucR family transcriptional regulator n=1 Tax=Aminobacter anthyllidis TaxID=1035067 RepID=A0A9X1D6V1_9HYPH|nr:MucR family transcriptional regulator [Aminobacter anthyllidis]MBT1159300.1 MucR family transcriptional regulator [Aminobacter anthyllidis]